LIVNFHVHFGRNARLEEARPEKAASKCETGILENARPDCRGGKCETENAGTFFDG